MKRVANENELTKNKDVKLLTIGTIDDFDEYLKTNPNMTQYGVVWCTSKWVVNENIQIPCQYGKDNGQEMLFYSLFYNFTLADNGFLKGFLYPMPKDDRLMKIKLSIDNSII